LYDSPTSNRNPVNFYDNKHIGTRTNDGFVYVNLHVRMPDVDHDITDIIYGPYLPNRILVLTRKNLYKRDVNLPISDITFDNLTISKQATYDNELILFFENKNKYRILKERYATERY
jgi:hypothetical protein